MTQQYINLIDHWVGSFCSPHTEIPEYLTLLHNRLSAINFDDPVDLDRFEKIVSKREFAASWGVTCMAAHAMKRNKVLLIQVGS